jgi:lysophospholipase L1-like esterase
VFALRVHHKIGLVVFSVLVCLGTLEIGARVYGNLAGQDRVLAYDSLLGWRPVPGARKYYTAEEQPYLIEINSKGLRDREHAYDKPAGVFRILFLGDSFVFGSGGVEQSRRFTELLEASAPGLEVINGGVPGYSPDQELQYFETEGYRYQPDLVVLSLFVNDLPETFVTFNRSIGRPKGFVSLENDALVFHAPSVSRFYRISQASYVLGWLDQRLRLSTRFGGEAANPVAPMFEAQQRTFSRLLVRIRDASRARNADFAIVYFPFKSQKNQQPIQKILADLAATERIPVLDVHALLQAESDPESWYFKRDVHMNERGHVFAARALMEFLSHRTAFGRRPRSPQH